MLEQKVTNENSVSSQKEDILPPVQKKRGRPRKAVVTPVLTNVVVQSPTVAIQNELPVAFSQQQISQEIFADLTKIEKDIVKLTKDSSLYLKNKAPILNIASIVLGLLFILGFYLYSLNQNNNEKQEVVISTPSQEKADVKQPLIVNEEVKQVAQPTIVDDSPIVLKPSIKLEDSIEFASGAIKLGPVGKSKAQEIYSVMKESADYDLFLYGYAGSLKNKERQKMLAKSRAISVKIYMVNELGANPKDIRVVDPKYYLTKEPLPVNDKQVKTVLRKK